MDVPMMQGNKFITGPRTIQLDPLRFVHKRINLLCGVQSVITNVEVIPCTLYSLLPDGQLTLDMTMPHAEIVYGFRFQKIDAPALTWVAYTDGDTYTIIKENSFAGEATLTIGDRDYLREQMVTLLSPG